MSEVTAVSPLRRYTAETADVKYLVDGYLFEFREGPSSSEYTEGISYHMGAG